jgi:hypothetical protein
MKTSVTITAALLVLLTAGNVRAEGPAQHFKITSHVYESTLNKLADEIGSLRGTLGSWELPRPCFPNVFELCGTGIRADLTWQASVPRFRITTGRIDVLTTVTARLLGLEFEQALVVRARLHRSGTGLRVDLDSVNVPITFTVGPVEWTPVTLHLTLNERFDLDVPVGHVMLPVPGSGGVIRLVNVSLDDATITAVNDAIRIVSEHRTW